MPINLRIFHKGLILVSLPLVFEVSFVLILVSLLSQAEQEIQSEIRAREIVTRVDVIRKLWDDAIGSAAVYRMSHRPSTLKRSLSCQAKIVRTTADSLKFVLDSAKSNQALEAKLMEQIQNNTADTLQQLKLFIDGDDMDHQASTRLQQAAEQLVEMESHIAKASPAERMHTRQIIEQALFGGLALNVVLTVLLTFFLSKSITSRLACVSDNTQKIANRQPLNPRVGGRDEIAELDDCLHETAAQLIELETFKRDMMSMVSHELRSPLSSIVLSLKLISDGALGELPDRAMSKIRSAETNADRLIRLINDLLNMDRIEAGMLELKFKELSLEQLLKESAEAVKELALKTEVRIDTECTAGTLIADYERLLQVVINLLSNAIKYSPKNGKITLTALDEPAFVVIRVSDEGRGIPAKFKDKVFDRFQQVDQFDPREKQGSGLGLAICKAIVAQHNGKIGVESEDGKGSSFWFRIPKDLQLAEKSIRAHL